MEFNEGENVVYTFPNPVDGAKKSFSGKIYLITDSWIFIKSEDDIILRVSFHNAGMIEQEGDKRKAV
ncbi:MAG: hypothetical protein SCALA702_32160 [Melioribacteraceae bacterium]|nr:MAG: hypothetical protein SCALA702_32160 [Melioribacteraceae bacterium]